jgi:hypothetical protein
MSSRAGTDVVHLPEFQKVVAVDPYVKPTAIEFASMDTFANGADAATGAGIGQLLRGIGPFFSLNNEAVAKLIEATAGAIVHKVAEKLSWCWYAAAPLKGNMIEADAVIADQAKGVEAAMIPAVKNAAPIGGLRTVRVNVSW